MTKAAYGEIINQVRKLCASETGTSIDEATKELRKRANTISSYPSQLVRDGEAFKAGMHGSFRYFKDEEDAKAHELATHQQRAMALEDRRKKKNELHLKKQREKRAKAREVAGVKTVSWREGKTKKKPSNLVLQTTEQSKDQLRQHKAAKIVYPEGFKKTIVPTYQDMRFKADPGYVGEFVKEWKGRLAA